MERRDEAWEATLLMAIDGGGVAHASMNNTKSKIKNGGCVGGGQIELLRRNIGGHVGS